MIEKVFIKGASSLSDVELIAFLLGYSKRRTNSFELAARLLSTFGGMSGLGKCSTYDLLNIEGIGKIMAAKLAVAFETGRRLMTSTATNSNPIRSPDDIHNRFAPVLCDLDREIFIVLGLNTKNRIILEHRAAEGSLNECAISPRDVFSPLIKCPASSAVLIHNHPSGDPCPSPEDKLLTIRMMEAGKLLGIKVLDHIIIGKNRYYSFRDSGAMD